MDNKQTCYDRYVDLTPEIVADMRATLDIHFGCWNTGAQVELAGASDDEVVAYIAKNYTGGVRGYCLDGKY